MASLRFNWWKTLKTWSRVFLDDGFIRNLDIHFSSKWFHL